MVEEALEARAADQISCGLRNEGLAGNSLGWIKT